MKILISSDAMNWFHEEMEAVKGDTIRFFARYGGSSPIHEGFSLGVTKDTPFEPTVTYKEEDILFFIEERDEWYFDGHDLYVDFDSTRDELSYAYKKA
ncbi:HesB/YadR/YfhF family protein [Psychrobacillus sp. INOP01]|uniref:HesB/YadR/YfhF family protein n=1 Tax=Psychrobacillus sp. INOP01 TaxID=2829187 RepID=UPI001BA770D2|nr:HesB/YadR/YfhF family protein [Psychrobacillus sp. INOP01]QUG41828.1 HesB/YadR/YfhF family protein [Psychrobacillus sp. INOP01]